MPKIAELRKFQGAMWARLDIDLDSGPISLYTEDEIKAMIKKERDNIITMIRNIDRVTLREDD